MLVRYLGRYLGFAARTPVLVIMLILTIFFSTWVFRHLPGLETPMIDLHFSYDHSQLMTMLDGIGEAGRATYLWSSGCLDMIFPLLYGSFFAGLIYRLRPSDRWWWLALMPLGAVVLDVAENLQVVGMLLAYPDIGAAEVWWASLATSGKWLMVYLTYALALAFMGTALIRRVGKRLPRA